MAQKPIHAAGGIVVRNGARPLIAVVQRSKDERWVLPRGKLDRDENPAAGARREVVEETGHRVEVHEFLGAITYRVRGRPKVVQFWRMHAAARPSRDVMKDIAAVEWLPLSAAVRRLSYPLEKLFLHHVGRRVLKQRRRKAARRKTARKTARPRHLRRPARRKTAVRRKTRKQRRRSGKARAGKSRAVTAATHHPRPSMLQRMLGRLAP
jgi:8-oxo-dGTP diphosphatase